MVWLGPWCKNSEGGDVFRAYTYPGQVTMGFAWELHMGCGERVEGDLRPLMKGRWQNCGGNCLGVLQRSATDTECICQAEIGCSSLNVKVSAMLDADT